MDFSLPAFSVHGDSPGKDTRVGFHALLQGSLLILSSKLILFLLWENLRRLSGEYRKFQKLLHSLENLIKLSFLHGNNAIIGLPQWLNGKKKKKKSACNAGDTENTSVIPGLGRSPGGGHGNPL